MKRLSNGKIVEKKIFTLYECAKDLANRIKIDGSSVTAEDILNMSDEDKEVVYSLFDTDIINPN